MTPAVTGDLAQGCGSLDMALHISKFVSMRICCNRQVLIPSCCSSIKNFLSNLAEQRLLDKHAYCISCPHIPEFVLKSDLTKLTLSNFCSFVKQYSHRITYIHSWQGMGRQ